jgi:hypothetical protein
MEKVEEKSFNNLGSTHGNHSGGRASSCPSNFGHANL